MCHWVRQRVEISLDVRTERRRQLYADLSYLSGDSGHSGAGDGIHHWASCPVQPPAYVPEAGTQGAEMGHLWMDMPGWKRGADCLLFRCLRLAYLLFCEISCWAEQPFKLRGDDYKSRRECDFSAHYPCFCLWCTVLPFAGRIGTGNKVHHVSAAGADGSAGYSQSDIARCEGRHGFLLKAGLFQNQRLCFCGCYEPGLFHPVHRYGRHGHLRQLHWQGAFPHG